MKKPYVICHLIASLDGRISGGSFYLPETIKVMDEHWKIRNEYGCDAVMNGAVTAAEIYADGFMDEEAAEECPGDRSDYVAETDLDHFVVCLDPDGRLNWTKNYVDRKVQPKSHVIEVLAEKVDDGYLKRLRDLEISYLFAGREKLDVHHMLDKLARLFGIERILVTGGGVTDWMLLEEGCIDEISVIITPTICGERDRATLFDKPILSENQNGIALDLIEVRELQGDGLLLRYRTRT